MKEHERQKALDEEEKEKELKTKHNIATGIVPKMEDEPLASRRFTDGPAKHKDLTSKTWYTINDLSQK